MSFENWFKKTFNKSSTVRIAIVGCGMRGEGYGIYALDFPEKLQVVAVAEPNEVRRKKMAKMHKLKDGMVFTGWEDLIAGPKLADAVVIATQDKQHCAPAVAFANAGYHILLEKPMAVSVLECQQIYEAVVRNNIIFSVGHVLRYTSLYRKLKELVDKGTVGEVVSINHMECIGYWHFAHSYVRGNWRNEAESTFSLLAKSCHDLDLIIYFMGGATVSHVSSFGSLNHFVKSKKPPAAGESTKCLECSYEEKCPYSAKKIYLETLKRGNTGWPISVVSDVVTVENVESDLQNGPYGRCVYECDNDVVDNQVVSIQFEGGKTANFTMVAFSEDVCVRKTRIFGTRGEIVCDGSTIRLFRFDDDSGETFRPASCAPGRLSGHFGGDFHLIDAFVNSVSKNDREGILSGPEETLHSHLLVFAAETARRTGKVIDFQDFIRDVKNENAS